MKENLPVASIIGRANVGKSTLFNTLLEKKLAITSSRSGTTRDRNYQLVSWRGFSFWLVDTGGLDIDQKKGIELSIAQQAQKAIAHSEVIIFLVDGQVGITKEDRQANQYLKKLASKIILAVNKIDNPKLRNRLDLSEFLRLGYQNPLLLSAKNGSGSGDLLDEITKKLPAKERAEQQAKTDLRLAVLGKPNVGKSSLLNCLAGEQRVIVDNQPYTTRDPQNIVIKYRGKNLETVDTAGVRKMPKIKDQAEKSSVKKSLSAVKKADLCLLLIDISQPIARQDSNLAQLIVEQKKPAVIVANKWDLVNEQDKIAQKQTLFYLQRALPQLSWAETVFTSALTGQNAKKTLDLAWSAWQEYNKELGNDTLAQFLQQIQKKPSLSRQQKAEMQRLSSLRQVSSAPPCFYLKIGKRQKLHHSYLRFLENRLREWFGFKGSPILLNLKNFKF